MLTLLILTACAGRTGNDTADSTPVVDTERGDCNPVDESACLLPFPSSFYLDEDQTAPSGYRVAFGPTSLPADKFGVAMRPDSWNRRDGFSTMAPLYALLAGADVHSPGSLSFDTLADYTSADVTTVIVDADTGLRVPHYIERESFTDDDARAALVMHPVVPLEHGHRYVVGIRKLLGSDGAPVAAPAGFATLRDAAATSDPDLERQRDAYDSTVFPTLEAAGFARADLQLAWDFVTVSAEGSLSEMMAVREAAFAAVPAGGPAYTITSTQDGTCTSGESVGRRIEGTITVPLYLESSDPGAFLNRDADGNVAQNGTTETGFTIVVPCSVLADAAPARLIQGGHGLFGQHQDIAGGTFTDVADRSHAIMYATSWRGLGGDDYNAVTLMMAGDPSDFAMIPDNLTQGHIEGLLMTRLMQGDMADEPALQVDGVSLIDPARVDYYGVSLGSVLGGAQVAMSPVVQDAVMQISGMPFSLLLTRSSAFTAFLLLLGAKYDDPVDISLIVPLAQMLWDPTEAGGWAHYLTDGSDMGGAPDRRFLFQVGIGDDTVTSIAGEVYARTVGAGLLDTPARDVFGLDPVTDPTVGSGLLEWDYGVTENDVPSPVGLEENPHNMLPGEDSAREQIAQFFTTGSMASTCDGVCDPE